MFAAPINHVAFSAVSGMVYTHDGEDRVKGVFLKPSMLGSEGRIAIHRGPVWVSHVSQAVCPDKQPR